MSATPPTIFKLCDLAKPGRWHACTRPNYTLGGDSIEIVILDEDGMVTDHVCEVLIDTGEDTPEDRKQWKRDEATAQLIARLSPDVVRQVAEALRELTTSMEVELDLGAWDDKPHYKRDREKEIQNGLTALRVLDGLGGEGKS